MQNFLLPLGPPVSSEGMSPEERLVATVRGREQLRNQVK
jgi:hypothetical protein